MADEYSLSDLPPLPESPRPPAQDLQLTTTGARSESARQWQINRKRRVRERITDEESSSSDESAKSDDFNPDNLRIDIPKHFTSFDQYDRALSYAHGDNPRNLPSAYKYMRREPTSRVSIVDFYEDGEIKSSHHVLRWPVTEGVLRDFKAAISQVASPNVANRVIFVEDLNTNVKAALGEEFDLDPYFFSDHVAGSTMDRLHGVSAQAVGIKPPFFSSSPVRFLQTRPKHNSIKVPGPIFPGDITRQYRSIEWHKIIALEGVHEEIRTGRLQMCREIFCPDVRLPKPGTLLEGDLMLYNALVDGELHAMIKEKISVCDLDVDGRSTSIILCDAVPTTHYKRLYRLWHNRGPWSRRIDAYSNQSSKDQSTKACLHSWMDEHATRTAAIGSSTWSIFPFILDLVARDSFASLEYIQHRAQAMQTAMLSNNEVRNNVQVWREWLGGSLYRLSRDIESVLAFLRAHEVDGPVEASTKKTWTALSTEAQMLLTSPISYHLSGKCTSGEIKKGEKMVNNLLESSKSTRETLKSTDDLLRTTLSLLESQRAISEAHSVTKLTELAFLFIPLSFSASFFSMPLDLLGGSVSLPTFVTFSVVLLSTAYLVRILIRAGWIRNTRDSALNTIRQRAGLMSEERIPTSVFILHGPRLFLVSLFSYDSTPWAPTIQRYWVFGGFMLFSLPIILLWTLYKGNNGLKGGVTVFLFFSWLFISVFGAGSSPDDEIEPDNSISRGIVNFIDVFPGNRTAARLRPGHLSSGVIRLAETGEESLTMRDSFGSNLWWQIRLSITTTPFLAPIILIWTVIPRNIGAQIGLSLATLLVSPLVWLAVRKVLYERGAGRTIIHHVENTMGSFIQTTGLYAGILGRFIRTIISRSRSSRETPSESSSRSSASAPGYDVEIMAIPVPGGRTRVMLHQRPLE